MTTKTDTAKKGRWIGLLVTLVLMIGAWYMNQDEKPEDLSHPSSHPVYMPTKKGDPEIASKLPEGSPPPSEFQEMPPEAPSNNLAEVLERFHSCVTIPRGDLPNPAPPSLNTWVQYLQSRLGETVFNSEEWRNTDLQLANGEKRRIRVEYDMGENEEYVKKLKYSIVGTDNQIIPLSVSTEHSENPTEAFIETLEKEGEVTVSEKAYRMYFKDGSELYAVERNGVVKDLDVSKDGKLFRCTQMDTTKFNCECL
jgi:hypothetical protein